MTDNPIMTCIITLKRATYKVHDAFVVVDCGGGTVVSYPVLFFYGNDFFPAISPTLFVPYRLIVLGPYIIRGRVTQAIHCKGMC